MTMDASFKVQCPFCQAALRSSKAMAVDKPLRCPNCKQSFVPGSQSSAAIATRPQSTPPVPVELSDSVPARGRWGLVYLAFGGLTTVCLVLAFFMWRMVGGELAPPIEKKQDPAQVIPKPGLKGETPATLADSPLVVLTSDEEAKIQNAVRKGVAWLKAQQRPDGTFMQQRWPEGETALAGLVLLEAGVSAADPAIKRAANFLRTSMSRTTHTYSLALIILFFDKLKDPLDEDLLKEAALRLVAGQRPQGGWDYECPTLTAGEHASLLAMLSDTRGKDLSAHQRQHEETWNRMPATMRGVTSLAPISKEKDAFYFRQGGDNSNTQFALLSLWTARRHGVPVDASLERVVHRFRRSQKADGAWVYNHTTDVSSPTMTCAGLLALAVEMGLSKELKKNTVDFDSVKKAFQKLGQHIGQPGIGDSAPPPTEMYFLWSVERVAVLYHKAEIEEKDWYRWGSSMLLKHQRPEGLWHFNLGAGSAPLTDTCFAILFLQRANLATDLTDHLRRAGD